MTNISGIISQLELWAPQEILLVTEIPTGVYLLSVTGAIATLERRIPRRKGNLKSPEILPPREYTIPNQYSTIIIIQNNPNLPPHLSKVPTVNKPFIDYTHFSNPSENEHTDTTDNLCTDNEDYVYKINVDKDEDKSDKYKE